MDIIPIIRLFRNLPPGTKVAWPAACAVMLAFVPGLVPVIAQQIVVAISLILFGYAAVTTIRHLWNNRSLIIRAAPWIKPWHAIASVSMIVAMAMFILGIATDRYILPGKSTTPLGDEKAVEAARTVVGKRAYEHLFDDQRQKLLECMLTERAEQFHVTVNSEPNCNECEDLAQELRDVASAAKWNVFGASTMISDAEGEGFRILTQDPTPPSATRLALCLSRARIVYRFGQLRPSFTGHTFFGPGHKQWEDYVVLIARYRLTRK